MNAKTRQLVTQRFVEHGVTDAVAARLANYVELLLTHGRKTNLVGTLEPLRIVDELLLDSLEVLPLLGDSTAEWLVVDVGSGAGIPAIPLLLARDSWSAVLIEPRMKRAYFLKHAARALGLAARVTVLRDRWTPEMALGREGGSARRLWVSRAVFAPDEWIARALAAAKPGDAVASWLNEPAETAPISRGERADRLVGFESSARSYRFGDGRERTIQLLQLDD